MSYIYKKREAKNSLVSVKYLITFLIILKVNNVYKVFFIY